MEFVCNALAMSVGLRMAVLHCVLEFFAASITAWVERFVALRAEALRFILRPGFQRSNVFSRAYLVRRLPRKLVTKRSLATQQ